MTLLSSPEVDLPLHQREIRSRCRHPSAQFVRFEETAMAQSITARFEQQVARHRDRIAVKSDHGAWTYGQLNRAANRTARAILARRGHVAEPVGLLFDNGLQAIAAALATLKAGKFYVPLDPTFPQARLGAILGDAGARLLLTDAAHRPCAARLIAPGMDMLVVDEPEARVPDDNVPALCAASDLACLIYTSGSTGRPKGVMQTHRSLMHWAMIHTNGLGITIEDRLTLLHSWSVASCLHHLWSSLLNGATLLPLDTHSLATGDLARWLGRERVTIYHSVPVLFRQMAAGLTGSELFADLRAVVLSGAPMRRDDVELYRRCFASSSILLHMMGTTETGWVRGNFIDGATSTSAGALAVGYPVADTEVALVDESGAAVECGKAGEIIVKSRYLAAGYWRQEDLTAARFAAASEGGELAIYRTGDLGRMQADGCLFHLGRKDFQVKVRGHRIETGEVERALLRHGGLKEAVAIGRTDSAGDTRLVAYYVPARGQAVTITELRRHLSEELPDHMIPAAFVQLEGLPATPNGKLDYVALPVPDDTRPELDAAYAEPATELERTIALIWRELLGLAQVGLHDNFFDLGGNSLLLTRLHSRLKADLGEEIPMVALFTHPTIEALARYVARADHAPAADGPDRDGIKSLRAGRSRLAQLAAHRLRAGRSG